MYSLLSQVHAWFVKIVSVRMLACVCVSRPKAINNLWCDMVIWSPYDWLNKFYSFYMVILVGIVNWHGLGIDTHHES